MLSYISELPYTEKRSRYAGMYCTTAKFSAKRKNNLIKLSRIKRQTTLIWNINWIMFQIQQYERKPRKKLHEIKIQNKIWNIGVWVTAGWVLPSHWSDKPSPPVPSLSLPFSLALSQWFLSKYKYNLAGEQKPINPNLSGATLPFTTGKKQPG